MPKEQNTDRLDRIFRELAQNRPHAQILGDIEKKEKRNEKNNQRREKKRKERREITGGRPTESQIVNEIDNKSQRRSREALMQLPVVEKAEITVYQSQEDQNMIDIRVHTVTTEPPFVRRVFVRVESNDQDLLDAKTKLQEQRGLSEEELDPWVLENKFIFLNGRKPIEDIQVDFLDQYNAIKRHHAAKNPDVSPQSFPK